MPDPEGGVWAGTAGRWLAHWDRDSWSVSTVEEGLPSNRVTGLAMREQTLLVATDAGLVEWGVDNRAGRGWKARDGLPSDQLTTLARRMAGGVWVGTSEGLCWVEETANAHRLEPAGPPWVTSLCVVEKLAFYERRVLLSGSPAGLVVRDEAEPEIVLARLGPEDGLPDGRVTALAPAGTDRCRAFWVGTDGGGLAHVEARKDRADKPFLEVHPVAPGPGSYQDGRVSALVCDSDQVRLASAASGLSLGKLLREPSTASSAAAAAPGAPGSGDSSGTTTSSTSGGANGCQPGETPVKVLNYNIGHMGPGWFVTAFGVGFRSVWAGFQDRGVAVASPPGCPWAFYPRVTDGHAGAVVLDLPAQSSVAREFRYTDVVVGGQVADIATDNRGVLWFATLDAGLGRKERNGFCAIGKAQGVPTSRTRRLFVDRPTGDLYVIAGNDQGYLYEDAADPTAGKVKPRDLLLRRSGDDWHVMPLGPAELVKELELNAVLPLARDGQLYVGTEHGLMAFDGRRLAPVRIQAAVIDLRTNKPVPTSEELRDRVSRTTVYDLFEGPAGVLWIATALGLFRDAGGLAVQVNGTEAMACWKGTYDVPTRMVYFQGSLVPEKARGQIPYLKGELFRYQPELGHLKPLVGRVVAYGLTPDAVWYSHGPSVGMISPKPIR
ncbi:MAG: hypothetical protein HY814_04340 [Candidatus Riflebacteria bacterium]|nr:hypothetical protein [Candidatus Riflebacteria bacterium]